MKSTHFFTLYQVTPARFPGKSMKVTWMSQPKPAEGRLSTAHRVSGPAPSATVDMGLLNDMVTGPVKNDQ